MREDLAKEALEFGLCGEIQAFKGRWIGAKEPDFVQGPPSKRRGDIKAVAQAGHPKREKMGRKAIQTFEGGGRSVRVGGRKGKAKKDEEILLKEVREKEEKIGEIREGVGGIEPCKAGSDESTEGRDLVESSVRWDADLQEGVGRRLPRESDRPGPRFQMRLPSDGIKDSRLFKEPSEGDTTLAFFPQGTQGQARATHVEAGGKPRLLMLQEEGKRWIFGLLVFLQPTRQVKRKRVGFVTDIVGIAFEVTKIPLGRAEGREEIHKKAVLEEVAFRTSLQRKTWIHPEISFVHWQAQNKGKKKDEGCKKASGSASTIPQFHRGSSVSKSSAAVGSEGRGLVGFSVASFSLAKARSDGQD